jgi:Sodium/calcium exchanger protein
VPLAALLSHATESVAEKTGDTVGGLLNATLGNLTELVIAAAALRAGDYALVKGSIAGAIVTNTLFMLGASKSRAAVPSCCVITLRTGEAKRRPNFSWEPAGTGPRPKRNCRNGLSLPKARLLCYLILRLCLAGARWHGPDNRQMD